jgi:hypothetical protein
MNFERKEFPEALLILPLPGIRILVYFIGERSYKRRFYISEYFTGNHNLEKCILSDITGKEYPEAFFSLWYIKTHREKNGLSKGTIRRNVEKYF